MSHHFFEKKIIIQKRHSPPLLGTHWLTFSIIHIKLKNKKRVTLNYPINRRTRFVEVQKIRKDNISFRNIHVVGINYKRWIKSDGYVYINDGVHNNFSLYKLITIQSSLLIVKLSVFLNLLFNQRINKS